MLFNTNEAAKTKQVEVAAANRKTMYRYFDVVQVLGLQGMVF